MGKPNVSVALQYVTVDDVTIPRRVRSSSQATLVTSSSLLTRHPGVPGRTGESIVGFRSRPAAVVSACPVGRSASAPFFIRD